MKTFHKSNLGSFGQHLTADMEGYIPTADCGPWELTYDHGTEATHDENEMNATEAINAVSSYRITESGVRLGPELLDQPDSAIERFGSIESVRFATVRYGATTMYCLLHQFHSRYDVEPVCRSTKLRPTKEMALAEKTELDMQTSYGSQWQRP